MLSCVLSTLFTQIYDDDDDEDKNQITAIKRLTKAKCFQLLCECFRISPSLQMPAGRAFKANGPKNEIAISLNCVRNYV